MDAYSKQLKPFAVARHLDAPKLTLVDLATSNCLPNGTATDPCKPARTFSVKKLPVVFWVFTHSDISLKDASFDVMLQLKDLASDKVLAQVTSSATLTYTDQQDVIYYPTQLPADLAALNPGRYKMYCAVLTADGVNFAEKTVIVTVAI
jgi:hypothetical protein